MKIIKIFTFFLIAIMMLGIINSVQAAEIASFEELKEAFNTEENEITITLLNDFDFNSKISISNKKVTIEGEGKTLSRSNTYYGGLFEIDANSELNLNNIIIDGKSADWSLDYPNQKYFGNYARVPVIVGDNNVQSNASLIVNNGKLNVYKSEFKNHVSTVKSGNIIYNNKDLTMEDSVFSKNYTNQSSVNGNVVYSSANSNIIVKGTKFYDNVNGNTNAPSSGSCFYVKEANTFLIDNCVFERNFSQETASCFFLSGTVFEIKNSTFIGNTVGNDSGVMCINTSSKLENKRVLIDNCIFDGNSGLSVTSGQSMASVIGTSGSVLKRFDIDIKNSEFKNNVASVGVISNHGGESRYIYINVDNCNFHDNKNTIFNSQHGNYTITNTIIENNSVTENSKRPSVLWLYLDSTCIIEDSIIRNNTSENQTGSTIRIRGVEESIPTTLIIKGDTQIYNNSAEKGGALYIEFLDNKSKANVQIEEGVKIHSNKAVTAGDDIFVNSPIENLDNLELTLIDADGMEINGIDAWYNDYEEARFDTSDTVSKYDGTNEGNFLALKAAGLNQLTYETNSKDEIGGAILKVNQSKNITSLIPEKPGYEFIYWTTNSDGTGLKILAGEPYDGREGYTLYAQYKKIEPRPNEVKVVKVGNTYKNDYHECLIIGLMFILVGIGVIVNEKKK